MIRTRGRREAMTGLVGRDLAVQRITGPGLDLSPLTLVLAVLLGLFIAALHMDQVRMQLALGDGMREVQRLEERQRSLLAELQTLRAPARLQDLAAQLGLGPPERSIELDPQASRPGRRDAPAATPALASERLAALEATP